MILQQKHAQLIQHLLHLLVDLIRRGATGLLVFSPASLALGHAQIVPVGALRRLAAQLPRPAGQSGGGRGHLLGGEQVVREDAAGLFDDGHLQTWNM